jgi:hypothetical protein
VTQPVQEPLLPRSVSALTWDRNQIFRRPAPISSAVNECAGYFGWSPTVSSNIPADTWTDIGTLGETQLNFVSLENNTNYSVDTNTMIVSWTAEVLVWVMGQIRFSSSFAAGDIIGVRLDFGGSGGATDIINLHTVPTGSPGLTNYYFDACGFNFAATTDVRIFVYQDSSATKTFESADLSVMTVAFGADLDVTFT